MIKINQSSIQQDIQPDITLLFEEILSKIEDGIDVESAKLSVYRRYHLNRGIRNSELIEYCKRTGRKNLIPVLRKRIPRTLSGVTPVAVMTVSSCPHGRCIYCPRGDRAPQSYTGREPAALRAAQNRFDPWLQVRARLKQYEQLGHPTDKCELIIMGGTFLAQSLKYKGSFIKGCYDGFNGYHSPDLPTARDNNEFAKHRVVGLTIETRPDWSKKPHINEMLYYGATRVELGVQTIYNNIYERIQRGHTVEDVVEATQLLKDSGFKICYHMMPGLFLSKEEDVEVIKKLFDDERFRPDMLKIYPTLVMEDTGLYHLWKRGEYRPYNTQEAMDVISEMYRYIPEYVRVMRVQRDIPTHLVIDGVKNSNLRQLVERQAREKGIVIHEIRYREYGMMLYRMLREGINIDWERWNKQSIKITRYRASGGTEYFISYENGYNAILGFVRLRIPYESFRPEITKETGLIRELHVYGSELPVGKRQEIKLSVQHKGIGRKLMNLAEEIAKDVGMKDMIVISGVGVRGYYRKLGYSLKGPYMWKEL